MAVNLLYLDTTTGYSREVNPLTGVAQLGQLNLNGVGGVAVNAGGASITNVATPVNPGDAVNKSYADGIAAGITWRPAVQLVATANISLTGAQTIDGIATFVGMRILCVAQTNAIQNGPWIVTASGNYTRPTISDDLNTGSHANGSTYYVEEGTTWANSQWSCITLAPTDVVDTNTIAFTQTNGLGDINVGAGLSKSGNTISVALAASNPGLQFVSNQLAVLLAPSSALTVGSTGIAVNFVSSRLTINGSNQLDILGVPLQFTVNGVATTTNVTAGNLNTLTAGPSSAADNLHTHQYAAGALAMQENLYANGTTALTKGQPVIFSATASTLGVADASTLANAISCFGVAAAAIAASATAANSPIVSHGPVAGVLSAATSGQEVFLAAASGAGGLTLTRPSASGAAVVRIGFAINPTDLWVDVQFLGIVA